MTSSHVRRLNSRVTRTAARLVEFATRNSVPVAGLPAARLPWYEIRSAADGDEPGVATILLFDEIGGSFGVDAKSFVEELDAITAGTIHLRINSPGGSVFDALAISSALRHHPARIVGFVDALAASAASVVAVAADELVMMPGSQLMIHDAAALEDGQADDMAKMATFLERQSDNIAGLYQLKGGGDAADWRALMREETWMFAQEAVGFGLADRVEEARKRLPEPAAEEALTRSFDLGQFRYAGRSAAPPPQRRTGASVGRTPELRWGHRYAGPAQQSGRRFGTLVDVEVRTLDDGSVNVSGHAAVFDAPTQIGPANLGFEEVISRGAFKKTIADGADVRFLFNHNPDLVLARTKSGTLTLREDGIGLAVEARLAPTSVGRDLAILLERGDVSQMSFGFRVVKDSWETVTRDDGSSVERRTVQEAQLYDVSGVTYPAYDETDLALREATLARELRDARRGRTSGEPAKKATPSDVPTPNPEPAKSTPTHPDAVGERNLPLHQILLRHAEGGHRETPRLLCPACSQPA